MDFVAMGLGGHAAEQLYLGEFTTGATSDLKRRRRSAAAW